MAGFLYFIPKFHLTPDHAKPTEKELRLWGLAHLAGAALSGTPLTPGASPGPIRHSGAVFAVDESSLCRGGRRLERVGYFPGRQQWRPLGGEEGDEATQGWLGWDPEDPPRAIDLMRTDAPHGGQGYHIKMANGERFCVTPYRLLPDTFEMGPGGTVRRVTKPEFLPMKEAAEKLYDLFYQTAAVMAAGGDVQEKARQCPGMDDTEMFVVATQFLTLTYRVGTAEVSALGLCDDEVLAAVMKAIVDFPSFETMIQAALAEAGKKKIATPDAGSPTAPGGPAR